MKNRPSATFALLLFSGFLLPHMGCSRNTSAAKPSAESQLEETSEHEASWDPEQTWAFEPQHDSFSSEAMLDLRSLNEKNSGQSGFVQISADGGFLRGDGQPLRFWAVGSEIYHKPAEQIDQHCRFLAKLGVNMVRLHARIANIQEGAEISDVNEAEIAGIFRFIQAAKENGIYLTLSPYYAHHPTPKSWKLPGYSETGGKPWGAIFIDKRMQAAYREWTRQLLTRINPHTGLAIKDDPTVAILQVHNEDSVFHWTFSNVPDALKKQLGRRYARWLEGQYGSLKAATERWEGATADLDDYEEGIVGLLGPWRLSQKSEGGLSLRIRDEVQFLALLQRNFYASMGRHLKQKLGCQQLLNASNWRTADDKKLKEIERWTYAALDVDAENEYYGSDYQHLGENASYRIDPGHHYLNESCLHKPLEMTSNYKLRTGHPFIVTETSWKHPNLFQTEGPFLISAYQSLGGVGAVFWFTADEPTWCLDPTREFWRKGDSLSQFKWSCSTPMLMGAFPAAALVYRNAYLKEGKVVVHEMRSQEKLWECQPSLIGDNEINGTQDDTFECKSARLEDGRISRAAFLVGPVRRDFQTPKTSNPSRPNASLSKDEKRPANAPADLLLVGSTASKEKQAAAVKTQATDFSRFLDAEKGYILSNTDELSWNYKTGLATMNAPCAQGVVGFLRASGGRFQLNDVLIQSQNDYAAVSVVSMDGNRLSESKKILVQISTMARLTGWKTRPKEFEYKDKNFSGREITNTGHPPHRIANAKVQLTVQNPNLSKCSLLDPSGYVVKEIALTQKDGAAHGDLPPQTMYLILH